LDHRRGYAVFVRVVVLNLPFAIAGFWICGQLAVSWTAAVAFGFLYLSVVYSTEAVCFFGRKERNDICVMVESIGLPKSACEFSRRLLHC